MTSIVIPNSVTTIGGGAFKNCRDLTSIVIPNSVTTIGSGAFAGCKGLTSIDIPNSIKSIGIETFENCSSLTSITIPNSVTSIGKSAFYYCCSLTSITIPNSVTSIGNGAFRDCSGLTSVTLGENVTAIGNNAFYGCNGLISITSLNTAPPQIDKEIFSNDTYEVAILKVPIGFTIIYKGHQYWKKFTHIEEIEYQPSSIEKVLTSNDDVTVVNLRGQRFKIKSSQINSLPKGIYIINGRKYSVK